MIYSRITIFCLDRYIIPIYDDYSKLIRINLPCSAVAKFSSPSGISLQRDTCCRQIQRLYLLWMPFVPWIHLEFCLNRLSISFIFLFWISNKDRSFEDKNGWELCRFSLSFIFNCLPLTYSVLVKQVPILYQIDTQTLSIMIYLKFSTMNVNLYGSYDLWYYLYDEYWWNSPTRILLVKLIHKIFTIQSTWKPRKWLSHFTGNRRMRLQRAKDNLFKIV